MPTRFEPTQRGWGQKFAEAFTSIPQAVRGQSSFYVHLLAAVAVIAAGVFLQVSRTEWCLLVLCIFTVLAAEMFNRTLELFARAITKNYNRDIKDGLNIASGAVLMMAMGAVVVGLLVLLPHLLAYGQG